MATKSSVIVLASPKGGAGKTTASLTLASEIAYQTNELVTIIDADPNHPFKSWENIRSNQKKTKDSISVIYDESEDTILENIEKARKQSRFVIIDLEGTKNMRTSYAISRADCVVIPTQGSILDANEAAQAIKLIRRAEKAYQRSIPYSLLFTRMPAAIMSRNFADIKGQMESNSIPVLNCRLVEREAFKTIFSTGLTLHELTKSQVSGIKKAHDDAYYFAESVIDRLKGVKQKKTLAA